MDQSKRVQAKPPTVMRYERVQDILQVEPVFRCRLGEKTFPVIKRNNEKVFFSKEVVRVTDAVHAEGLDAHNAPKNDVLRIAAQVLELIPSSPEPDQPVVETIVPPPPQQVAQVAPVEPVQPKREVKKKSQAPTKATEVKPVEPVAPTPTIDPDKQRHYQVQSSIYSLILTALNLSLAYEVYPNGDKRRSKLDALAAEYGQTCNQISPS